MTKAIVVDAKNRDFHYVEIGPFTDYYKHLDCQCFTLVALPEGDMYVDDEGLYRADTHGFVLGQPLRGNGVIVGPCDLGGNSTDVRYTLDEVREMVRFFGGEDGCDFCDELQTALIHKAKELEPDDWQNCYHRLVTIMVDVLVEEV